jgi:type I restriction enzyme S subunit
MSIDEITKRTPDLRYSKFQGLWTLIKLSDICTFFSGGTPTSSNKAFYNGDIPFIGSGNIHDNKISTYITSEALNSSSAKLVKKGDILYALYGANSGDVAISKLDGAINQAILCIRTESQSLYFIYLLLLRSKDRIISTFLQGGQGNLSANIIRNIRFHLPSLPEQQKIAAFLSAVDQRIHQLTKKKNLLEEYKKGVMQKIFSHEIRFRPDQAGAPGENGEAFPDWEEKRLGDMAQIVGGGTPDTNKADYWNGDIQWFTPTEIRKKYLDKSVRTITQYGLQNSSAKVLPTGTILFTSRATIAEVAFCTTSCTTNQGFQSLIVNDRNDPELVYHLIIFFRKRFIRKSQGSTFLEISSREMKNIKFHVPCLVEQYRIGGLLSSLDTMIDKVDQQITETQTFKKGLLQQMFV